MKTFITTCLFSLLFFAVNAQNIDTTNLKDDSIKADYKAKQYVNRILKKYGRKYGSLIIEGTIQIGMTKAMVKEARGEPEQVNRTVGSTYILEQWVYPGLGYKKVYFYFKNGKVVSFQD